MEESEPEESEEDVPVRKVSKGKKKVCFGRGASSATCADGLMLVGCEVPSILYRMSC